MVDTFQPRSLSCFRIRKRRHDNKMNLQNKKAPKTLNVTWAEERSELLCSFQSPGMFFLLTLPFIERGSRTELFNRPTDVHYTSVPLRRPWRDF